MAATKARKTPAKAASHGAVRRSRSSRHSLLAEFPVRTLFVVAGVIGLAALGIALFGPRRFRDEIIKPIGALTYEPLAAAVAPQADRAWAETRAWRDRVGRILESINTADVRDQVAARLANWVDRFR
jgi:hypothetical protein